MWVKLNHAYCIPEDNNFMRSEVYNFYHQNFQSVVHFMYMYVILILYTYSFLHVTI